MSVDLADNVPAIRLEAGDRIYEPSVVEALQLQDTLNMVRLTGTSVSRTINQIYFSGSLNLMFGIRQPPDVAIFQAFFLTVEG